MGQNSDAQWLGWHILLETSVYFFVQDCCVHLEQVPCFCDVAGKHVCKIDKSLFASQKNLCGWCIMIRDIVGRTDYLQVRFK